MVRCWLVPVAGVLTDAARPRRLEIVLAAFPQQEVVDVEVGVTWLREAGPVVIPGVPVREDGELSAGQEEGAAFEGAPRVVCVLPEGFDAVRDVDAVQVWANDPEAPPSLADLSTFCGAWLQPSRLGGRGMPWDAITTERESLASASSSCSSCSESASASRSASAIA